MLLEGDGRRADRTQADIVDREKGAGAGQRERRSSEGERRRCDEGELIEALITAVVCELTTQVREIKGEKTLIKRCGRKSVQDATRDEGMTKD